MTVNPFAMRPKISFLILTFFCSLGTVFAQADNIAERLGYSKDAKLLIIHADDLGVTHSENKASIKAMEEGSVNSASIMVPCPWFPEIANYAKHNPEMDFGLHLTLTSEWKFFKWGPSTPKHDVGSLVNGQGYFYDLVPKVVANADVDHIEIEIRNQVKKALDAGINVTHLDSHMGTLFATPDFTKAYIKVGQEFKLPVLLTRSSEEVPPEYSEVFELLGPNDVLVDRVLTALPDDFAKGMEQFYTKMFNELPSGLSCLLIHTAYDDEEMQAVTIDHPEWGAAWRQDDFDFFTSEKCKALLKANNIKLVTWMEIRDKITRAE